MDSWVAFVFLQSAYGFSYLKLPLSFIFKVNSAFNGKRKMLRRSLRHICTSLEIEQALKSSGLPMTVCVINLLFS